MERAIFYFGFLFGRCVSADAAADLAAGEDFGFLKTFPAADAAFALVTSPFFFLAICHFLIHRLSKLTVDKPCIIRHAIDPNLEPWS